MAAIKNVLPALSAARPSRSSSWPAMRTIWWSGRRVGAGITREKGGNHIQLAGQTILAAPSPTHIRFPVHLAAPATCPRIMRWRTSCGPPNPVAGAVCRAMIGCYRHCRGHNAHKRANAEPYTVTRATPPRGARAAVMNNGTQIPRKTRGPQAVASPIPMI